MKKILAGVALLSLCLSADYTAIQKKRTRKKKVFLFSSKGGGGQLAIGRALKPKLSHYEVHEINVLTDILGDNDPLKTLSFGYTTAENAYNWAIKHAPFLMSCVFYPLGQMTMKFNASMIDREIDKYLQKHKPDLVCSYMPYVNRGTLKACKKLNIPFVLFLADSCPGMYLVGTSKIDYDKFRIAIPFPDAQIKQIARDYNFPEKQTVVTGYPVGKDFLYKKNIPAIKKEFKLPIDKPIIMLLFGAQGSKQLPRYARRLKRRLRGIKKPVHLILCTGRSEKLKTILAKIDFPAHITTSIIGFTSRIADLMATSDILVSKSGTVSVAEALYSNTPFMLDSTSDVAPWEKENHYFIKRNECGDSIKRSGRIIPKIINLLNDKNKRDLYVNNCKKIATKNGAQELADLIDSLLVQS